MKLLIDVDDDKAAFFLEMLANFEYVKAEQLSAHKAEVFSSLQKAVREMNQVTAGNLETRDAEDFLNDV